VPGRPLILVTTGILHPSSLKLGCRATRTIHPQKLKGCSSSSRV
jgi:hypothetical protein